MHRPAARAAGLAASTVDALAAGDEIGLDDPAQAVTLATARRLAAGDGLDEAAYPRQPRPQWIIGVLSEGGLAGSPDRRRDHHGRVAVAVPPCDRAPEGDAMAGTLSPWPLVRQGDQDHPVRTLQWLLRARGHSVAVDGIFGPLTDAAVRAFQRQKGLVVDGIVGPYTWAALIIQVRQGGTGDAVRGVQEEFQFRNLSGDPSKGLAIDGIFGPNTDAAVRGFQDAVSKDVPTMAVDGIVGPMTWQALVSGMLSF